MRKQTPPVSTDEPPIVRPIVTFTVGESPTPSAKPMPASRHMCRIDWLGRIFP